MRWSHRSDSIRYDVVTMREIGIRELKAKLSEVLRSIEAGESVRVTNHGKPVADIVPPKRTSGRERLEELVAQGRVRGPKNTGRKPPPPPRVTRPAGSISASDQVIADREAERD